MARNITEDLAEGMSISISSLDTNGRMMGMISLLGRYHHRLRRRRRGVDGVFDDDEDGVRGREGRWLLWTGRVSVLDS